MKIRKNHTRKRYRYNVNRKTLNKTRRSTGKIKDLTLKKLWEDKKHPNRNFEEMGLSADPNKTLPMPNFRQNRLNVVKIVNGFVEEDIDENEQTQKAPNRPKGYVVEQLEEYVNQPRESLLRLPKGVIKELEYFLDKYKFDYKAMVGDRRNHYQWTWKQFRMKIRKFMSIPEQFNVYLQKRNLKVDEKLPWPEYESDSEWQ